MNRRGFLLGAAATPAAMRAAETKVLLPSDQPDENGFRLMWYNPVPPIDQKTWRLTISGLVEKPAALSVADLRKLPHEQQSSRMKCVQCWPARTTWGGFGFHELVDIVKPKPTAKAVRMDCADKWHEYFSLRDLLWARVLPALDMAGQPHRPLALRRQVGQADHVDSIRCRRQGKHGVRHRPVLSGNRRDSGRLRSSACGLIRDSQQGQTLHRPLDIHTAPPDFPLLAARQPVKPEQVFGTMKDWGNL